MRKIMFDLSEESKFNINEGSIEISELKQLIYRSKIAFLSYLERLNLHDKNIIEASRMAINIYSDYLLNAIDESEYEEN